MPYAVKAKAQQFARRKPNLMKKADQLARLCHADVALIIRRNERYYTYRSTDHQQWPPSMTEIVRMKPMYRALSLLELRKPRTRCLSICCPKTLITLFVGVLMAQKWRTCRIRRLVQSRLREVYEC